MKEKENKTNAMDNKNNKRVRATVCAIIEKNKEISLVKRNTEPFKGYWSLPGGHIDFGESAKEAVVREVQEETGLNFKPEFLGYRDELYSDINWHGEVLVFYGKAEHKEKFADEKKLDKREISEVKWFDFNEAIKMRLAFGQKKTLEMYRKFKMSK